MREGYPNAELTFNGSFDDFVGTAGLQVTTTGNDSNYVPKNLENNDLIIGSGRDYDNNLLKLKKGYQYEFDVEIQFKGVSSAFAITAENIVRGDGDGSVVPSGTTMQNYTGLKAMIVVGYGGSSTFGEVAPAGAPVSQTKPGS